VSIKVLDWAQWIQNLSALGVAVCKIAALMLPDEEVQTTTNTSEAKEEKKETLEEKINELKRLKENGVITEEQYEEGVKNLISK
jgi:DNA-binding transcriptional MerR regulator